MKLTNPNKMFHNEREDTNFAQDQSCRSNAVLL